MCGTCLGARSLALPKAMLQLPLVNTHQHAAPPACCHTALTARRRPRSARSCQRLLLLQELPPAQRRQQAGAQRTHLHRMHARAAAQQTEPADGTAQDLLIVGAPSRSSACLLTSRRRGALMGRTATGPGVLGSYLGTVWREQHPSAAVVGLTNSTTNHERCGIGTLLASPYLQATSPPAL